MSKNKLLKVGLPLILVVAVVATMLLIGPWGSSQAVEVYYMEDLGDWEPTARIGELPPTLEYPLGNSVYIRLDGSVYMKLNGMYHISVSEVVVYRTGDVDVAVEGFAEEINPDEPVQVVLTTEG